MSSNSKVIQSHIVGTTSQVSIENTGQPQQEFGRVKDVEKVLGIKRGILYGLINDGKIKSVCLRKPGNIQGVRLIHMQSVRDYINSQFNN